MNILLLTNLLTFQESDKQGFMINSVSPKVLKTRGHRIGYLLFDIK